MTRLFIRILIGMALASFLAFWLNHLVIRGKAGRYFNRNPPGPFRGFAYLINERLSRADEPERLRVIHDLEREFGSPMRLLEANDPEIPESVRSDARQGVPFTKKVQIDSGAFMMYLSGIGTKVLVMGPINRFHIFDEETVTMLLAVSLSILGLGAFLLAFPLVRRLRRMEHAAMRISRGELDARTNVQGKDAIGTLEEYFNRMADSNQRLIENQRQLLQAVAHELRTPTARVRFGLEMLRDADENPKTEARITAIDEDLTELDELVEELLLFNRFDHGAPPLEMEAISVFRIVREVSDKLSALKPGIRVDVRPNPEVFPEMRANPLSVKRVVANLLSNALRYAHNSVTISTEKTPDGVCLTVSDDGPGIPEAERKNVLEPFARLDPSRSKMSGGVGLGLAIVQRILDRHGGRVEIGDGPLGGAAVRTYWPNVT